MAAGHYRDRVTIERQAEEPDEFGNVSGAWSAHLTLWADVLERTGGEKLAGGAIEAGRLATVRLRSSSASRGITAADRLVARGDTWNIRSIANVGRKGDVLELLCEAGVAT
ncbi:head-tail adaptor protein [Wenxinia saemankumensis]|uniref:Head-tail adaptor n=1 Tax=Wenxinia saemankumensis TaxID=1447782 RepID=A0A1M6EZV0_9RHOB|nr:head-tail adaptor protein [Wenxinia saemankumensis]SHI90963.1 head-tail adaptor [Wenxinia saemankumensis]